MSRRDQSGSGRVLSALDSYITEMWPVLTRSCRSALEAIPDSKLGVAGESSPQDRWPLYVSGLENLRRVRDRLRKTMDPAAFRKVEIRVLSGAPEQITEHGLVYLPGRYVVPGGRFNEMYGWDSYFIALGLLAEGRERLAQSMADQQLYQVKHYGTVLNCNRTYCLTRSQPPFLGRLVLAVFDRTGDKHWLRDALPHIERFHAYWTSMPQFIPGLGLSRYYALGDGPAPEALHGELDESGRNHYERLKEYLRALSGTDPSTRYYYDSATDGLTLAAYRDDRTIRESGFDLTGRFGLCGMGVRDHAAVCLNTLLWQMEQDIAEIRRILDASPQSIDHWESMAEERLRIMQHRFWDERRGLFQDWQLSKGSRRDYPFLTTFWPLWAGWAAPEQAASIVKNLSIFEAPYGLVASAMQTGCQWDAPYMWAPLLLMAVQGMERYGHRKEASRIANRFIDTIACDFERTGQLFEKYNAHTGSSSMEGEIVFGYPTNEPGFGWTNAAVRLLLPYCASGKSRKKTV